MARSLGEWLEDIGKETYFDDINPEDGSSVTKDEQIARLIFKRALGCNEEIENEDGTKSFRRHPPSEWAQKFIFERREGKSVDKSGLFGQTTPLDRINEMVTREANELTQEIVDSDDTE